MQILPPFIELTEKVLDKIDITEEEIKDVIVNLDPNKTSGHDLISNKIIKQVATAIAKPLRIIFNRSLHESIFPDIWKSGNLVPLFKKEDRSISGNYRPYSLLGNFGKIQERIVFKHIYNHLLGNNFYSNINPAFGQVILPHFNSLIFFHHICKSFDEKQYSCMVFCDISKAFDKV